MKQDSFDSSITNKTLGTISFTHCGPNSHPLFRVNPDIPIESALEHASNLLTCINDLSLDAALGDAGKQSVWAVHYLSDMARAIVESALADRTVGIRP
jgi:DNA-binding transcriptional LysR family regulator